MAPDELRRDRLDHVAEGERALLLGHPGMEDHLEQQIAEFVPQIGQIAALDGVHDLIGFLERVGRDRRESPARDPRGSRCPGVRSAAMISRRRVISLDGFMVNSRSLSLSHSLRTNTSAA